MNMTIQRVPLEISLGPELFQMKMQEVPSGLDCCDTNMDDTIVYGKTETEHDNHLEAVIKRIKESA